MTANNVSASMSGCAGQRCMAASAMVGVGKIDHIVDAIVEESKKIIPGVNLGAVISREAKERIEAYITEAEKQGAKILLDGRSVTVPGCEDGFYVGKSLGGVPKAAANKGADCISFDQENNRYPCSIEPWDEGEEGEVKVVSEKRLDVGTPLTFDLQDFSLEGDRIEMRALDDLAGCASILAALIELTREPVKTDIFGIFTRAEEVGLVGAGLISAENTVPVNTFIVSVETSSVIPGVEQGMGPVIRTGDASYTFDAEAEQILALAKNTLVSEDQNFKCQRQLMAAGSCEATAFAVHGYSTTGVAFPLGNWHNATTKIPDPNGSIGMENISLEDFMHGTDLIYTSASMVHTESVSPLKERLREVQEKLKNRLNRLT